MESRQLREVQLVTDEYSRRRKLPPYWITPGDIREDEIQLGVGYVFTDCECGAGYFWKIREGSLYPEVLLFRESGWSEEEHLVGCFM